MKVILELSDNVEAISVVSVDTIDGILTLNSKGYSREDLLDLEFKSEE